MAGAAINKEITFDQSWYGPGDTVSLTARGVPVEGGPGKQLLADISTTVDGKVLRRSGRLGADPR